MWNCGVLGRNSPVKLLETLVYMLGLNLGLRSGEHRKLRRDMLEVRTTVLTSFLFKNHVVNLLSLKI